MKYTDPNKNLTGSAMLGSSKILLYTCPVGFVLKFFTSLVSFLLVQDNRTHVEHRGLLL